MELFIHSFIDLRWQDLLDIFINSFIIFRLYILFRGTNVIRGLLAIVALWLLKRLAMMLGLVVTSWVIQAIIAVATLVIIIVFRNEIGSAFKARSLKFFFWGIPQRQLQTPVDIIADSVGELAHHKLGALIVLPLKKGIEDIIHGGIQWQGKLSKEMLLSIFWHGTPVHDGAVIIQGDRILEVGAILPVSKSNTLPSHFGTRHRAAAGLSEQTDALVIVVSEERGGITLFKDKEIFSLDTPTELNQKLQEYVGMTLEKKRVRNQVIELSAVATACLVFTTGMWYSFARGLETLTTVEVPVEFVNRDPKMKVFSASVSTVKLQISGSKSLIRSVTPNQLKVKLNLANTNPGDNTVTLNREGIVLPPGLELKQVEPQSLNINLDVLGKKTLPVQANWAGKLPDDMILVESSIIPENVEVTGGNLALDGMHAVYTEPISLDKIGSDGKVDVGLMLLPSSLKLADNTLKNVEVRFKVQERPRTSKEKRV